MEIQEQVPLAPYTSFGIGGPARYFVAAKNAEDAAEAIGFAAEHDLPLLVLGGGSNMLVADAGYSGMALHMANTGIDAADEDACHVLLHVQAGGSWDEVVAFATAKGLWGIENLAAIPGSAGAVPVQNVGAYGQDASQVIVDVVCVARADGSPRTFLNADCTFGYRSSIFNTSAKGEYVITAITLRLSKIGTPNTSYAGVREYLDAHDIAEPTSEDMRQAITAIRAAKLPDPKVIGNAGSFFKNPIINGEKKSAAALIEESGLKGFALGPAKISDKHALVITNTGGAKASDILALAAHIRKTVLEKTGITLEPEPNFIGFTPEELKNIRS